MHMTDFFDCRRSSILLFFHFYYLYFSPKKNTVPMRGLSYA